MTIKQILFEENIGEKSVGLSVESLDELKTRLEYDSLLISVIIPVYNEENSIKEVLERIPNHHRYEIILIDDGSTDRSIKKVKQIKGKNIIVVKHNKNLGYGAALLTGFKHAKGDIIVTLDSDFQHNPEEIPSLINPIIKEEADLVIGSRYLGSSNYKVPLHTRFGELIIKLCLKLLYGQVVGNNQSGFRAFKRELLKPFIDINNNGMAFTTELLLKAMEEGKKILEVPIALSSRRFGSSYVRLFKVTTAIISLVIIYSIKRFKITRILLKRIIPYLNKIFELILKE